MIPPLALSISETSQLFASLKQMLDPVVTTAINILYVEEYGGNLPNVRRNIDFDILHGVTKEEVSEFLEKIQNDPSFSDIRRIAGSIERIKELETEKR